MTDESPPQNGPFKLYLITDRRSVRNHDVVTVCERALEAAQRHGYHGWVGVQLRERDLDAHRLYALALRMASVCRNYNAPLLINDRIDIALAADARGAHLRSDSIRPGDARRLIPSPGLIGVSTHTPDEVVEAAEQGADFAVFGPVFEPLSKRADAPPVGTKALADVCQKTRLPVFALGGITPEHVADLAGSGAAGVAVIGSVFAAEDPADATLRLLEAVARWLNPRPAHLPSQGSS